MIEVTGKTYEEALANGLKQLDLTIADVDVLLLEEGSKGLLGLFGSRPYKLRITPKEQEAEINEVESAPVAKPAVKEEKPAAKEPAKKTEVKNESKPKAEEPASAAEPKQAKTRKPRAEKPAQPAESVEIPQIPHDLTLSYEGKDVAQRARAYVEKLAELMGVPVTVTVDTNEEGTVQVKVDGDEKGILIGRRGETLDAIQYLTLLYANKEQDGHTRVTVDANDYRAKRQEALIRLANRMANRAVKTGRRVSLEPMNPNERRIIHMALQDHDQVETHSEGEEPNRHLVITLKSKPRKASKPVEEQIEEAATENACEEE